MLSRDTIFGIGSIARRARLVLLIGIAAGSLHGEPGSAQPLTTGFDSWGPLTEGTPSTQSFWMQRAADEGAGMVRLNVNWSKIAPVVRSRSFVAANPASPGYDWSHTDEIVRALTAHHLQILMTITYAPRWAEGAHVPAVNPGTWRPNPIQLAKFATAAATRYSGRFPDPLQPGRPLPQIRFWQAWNEPNLATFLNPQWIRAGHGWHAASPTMYRQLLNAFYGAVKRVAKSNFVVAAGTAPYGDPPGGYRIRPLAFDRGLFCLADDAKLSAKRCRNRPRLDAIDHHAYGIYSPLWHARVRDDVAVADVGEIRHLLGVAERDHHVLPAGPKRLWVTETSWDSDPPDPHGVPLGRQARFVEQTMYVLWSQGVDTVMWLQIVDSPPIPSYEATNQGGMYFADGQPKPAAQALRFPFVTRRRTAGLIQTWGRAPEGGFLTIERRQGSDWRTVRGMRLRAGQVFRDNLAIRGSAELRARMGSETSLPWPQSGH